MKEEIKLKEYWGDILEFWNGESTINDHAPLDVVGLPHLMIHHPMEYVFVETRMFELLK